MRLLPRPLLQDAIAIAGVSLNRLASADTSVILSRLALLAGRNIHDRLMNLMCHAYCDRRALLPRYLHGRLLGGQNKG